MLPWPCERENLGSNPGCVLFSSPVFLLKIILSYLVGGNITSVAISATAGGNITSVALNDTCFSVVISLALLLYKDILMSDKYVISVDS